MDVFGGIILSTTDSEIFRVQVEEEPDDKDLRHLRQYDW